VPRRLTVRPCALAVVALSVLATGCGGTSKSPAAPVVARVAPDLAGFLRLPVATPSACPPTANGATVGRRSPWVGHVDVSVFLDPAVTTHETLKLGNDLRADPAVRTVYFESATQAYAEFQRLYTCWSAVSRSQTPASYRVVLAHTTTLAARDQLVRRLARRADVDSVSCDPSLPCTAQLPSADPSS
jgi:FtsX extracellular domain